jgi:hypothetical protein
MDASVPPPALAQRLVVRALRHSVAVNACEPLGPWSLARLRLGGAESPSVIMKWLRDHPAGLRADASQILTEVAALEFLEQYCPKLAPRLLVADLEARAFLMEDLAPRRPLLDLLASGDPAGSVGLASFALTLARLHAATHGHSAAYYERRARLGHVDPLWELRRFFEPLPDVVAIGHRIGAPFDSRCQSDLDQLLTELTEPGPFLAFSNGDSGANNFLVIESDGRLIDFEFAGFRHCLTDVVCLYVPGSQWMTVGDPSLDGAEASYRSAVASSIPEAEDERRYGLGIVAAGLAFALMRLGRLSLLDSRPSGHESRRQMVATLSAAALLAERLGVAPALRGWVRRAEVRLRHRWPDSDVDLSRLAPYSPRV